MSSRYAAPRPSPRFVIPALLAAVALLPACGDEPSTPPGGGNGAGGSTTAQDGDGDGGTAGTRIDRKPVRKPEPVPLVLPETGPLSAQTARNILFLPLTAPAPTDDVRNTLIYLADLKDASALAPVRDELLAKEAEGYYRYDFGGAAIGYEALLLFGDADAAGKIVEVAQEAAADELGMDLYVIHALGRLRGTAHQPDAESLLQQAVLSEEPEIDVMAAGTLAGWSCAGAREVFARTAGGEELDEILRGACIAGLVALGDPRGDEILRKTVADEDRLADVGFLLEGMGVEGIEAVVPMIKRTIATLEAADEVNFESEGAARALAAIYGHGRGEEHADFLRHLFDEYGEPYAALQLWSLGHEEYAAAVAEDITRTIVAVSRQGNSDTSDAVYMLERIAEHGGPLPQALEDVVRAAAQVKPAAIEGVPDASLYDTVRALHVAGSYAYLKTRAK